jgi:hypothetical protein
MDAEDKFTLIMFAPVLAGALIMFVGFFKLGSLVAALVGAVIALPFFGAYFGFMYALIKVFKASTGQDLTCDATRAQLFEKLFK